VSARGELSLLLLWGTREYPHRFALEWSLVLDSWSHPVDDEF